MKNSIICIMVSQVVLFSIGLFFLLKGDLFFGLFTTVLNLIFFFINLQTLKNIKNEK